MKHLLTDDERTFLLEPLPSDGKSDKQIEYLEGGKAILRAIKTLYPQQPATYVAFFLVLSLLNTLELKFNASHSAPYITLASAILSNIIGLYLLRRNDTGWTDRGMAILRARELPSQETFRHLVTTFSAALFLLPGLLFSCIGLLLLITPLRNKIASLLLAAIEKKFSSL